MKPKQSLRQFLALAGSTLLAVSSAHAQVYWDTDGTTAGFGTASGTWGTDAFWNTSTTGQAGTFNTTNATTVPVNFGNGATGLGAGTINVSGTVDSGSMTFASGSGAIVLSGGTINLAAATTITNNSAAVQTISSAITGAATSLTKAGTGRLILSGTSTTRTGGTTLTAGNLTVAGTSATTSMLGTGALTWGATNTTLQVQRDNNITIANNIGANGRNLTRTFVVDRLTSGAAVNLEFTGSHTSGGGSPRFDNGSLLNFQAGANITSGTATITLARGTFTNDSLAATLAGTGTGAAWTLNPTGVNVVIANMTTNSQRRAYIFQGDSVGNEVTGIIQNGSGTEIRKAGTGTWTFSGANQYAGVTEVNAGTLRAGAAASGLAFGTGSAVTMANVLGATLDLNGFSQTIGSLAGGGATGGNVTLGANATLTTGGNSTNTSYAGIISGSGTSGLTKSGSGTLTLSGINTYTGNTTVSGGTLAISGSGSIANTPRIQINSSTTLDVAGISGTTFTVGTAQTLAGNGTVAATGKTVNMAGTLAPGASPGTITQDGGTMQLAVGGDYNWQILNAAGAAGTGYDTTNLTSGATLDLSLLSTGNTYNINLWSLSGIGPDVNGDATFNNALAYSWTLFSTGTAITGFSADKFTINTSAFNGTTGFSNALGGGIFGIGLADSNTNLVLTFTPIPEPSTALLGALGLLALLRRRR